MCETKMAIVIWDDETNNKLHAIEPVIRALVLYKLPRRNHNSQVAAGAQLSHKFHYMTYTCILQKQTMKISIYYTIHGYAIFLSATCKRGNRQRTSCRPAADNSREALKSGSRHQHSDWALCSCGKSQVPLLQQRCDVLCIVIYRAGTR
jgi:hypothetical protein